MTETVTVQPAVPGVRERRQGRARALMRVACAVAWIVGPPIALVQELTSGQLHAVGTPEAGTAQQQLALLAAHSGEVMAMRVADYLFELIIFVAWLGIVWLFWHRYPVMALISGVLAVIGLTGAMGVVALETMRLELAESTDHAGMAAAYAGLDTGPVAALFLPLFLVGIFGGLCTTAITVLITGVLSRIAAAGLLTFIAIDIGITVPFSGFWILTVVGLVWGGQLLRMSASRWRGEVMA